MDYQTIATDEVINKTAQNLKERGVDTIVVENKEEALETIKKQIPSGASIMNGASITLEQIGFVDYLKSGAHPWSNLHERVLAEKDPAKQAQLRREATVSDYYLGSIHGLATTGEFIVASNTGSQLPGIVFNSSNVIFVAGAQKIVPTLADALNRLNEYIVPLEDKHMQELYGINTSVSKILIFNRENPMMGRKISIILVKEKLGF